MLLTFDSFWLENSAFSSAIRQSVWLYPAIASLHLLSLTMLIGAIVMFDLRLVGYSRQLLVTDLAQHLLPWAYGGFVIAVSSGLLLFAVDASELIANPAFRLKLLLILAAVINATLFRISARAIRVWNRSVMPPLSVRIIALSSLLLWTSVLIGSRLMVSI